MFKPLAQAWERVEVDRTESDTSLFHTLLYVGEMVLKVTVAGLVAALQDDRERHRYRALYQLVRADGVGEWDTVLTEILTGPAGSVLLPEAREEQKALTERLGSGSWQYEAVVDLHSCLTMLDPALEALPRKVSGRGWISAFVRLRNKTRAHGALRPEVCTALCPKLEQSVRTFAEAFSLFSREWAYLHRNLSGKYRVTPLSETSVSFEHLKRTTTTDVGQAGVFVSLGGPTFVELLESSVDGADLFVANGAFTDTNFEVLSYITGETRSSASAPYMAPATGLPPSETHGTGDLEVQGEVFGNLPQEPAGYVKREALETEVIEKLSDDHHLVVTLAGRGGIGKTYLALRSAWRLAASSRFDVILWFSARDIDLLASGAKLVQPTVRTVRDVATHLVALVDPVESREKGFDPVDHLQTALCEASLGKTLFVFDNFETVRNPAEIYEWLDTYIRPPSKICITTRFRDFKGDYPIVVSGMTEQEFEELIDAHAKRLDIAHLVDTNYKGELYQETEGHPYVAKVMLGEVAKAGKALNVPRLLAREEDLLDALFERTYGNLSPTARRLFLTLCNWRSVVSRLSLEAALLRPGHERMDVNAGVDELARSSLIDVLVSESDNEEFLSVPVAASVFGQRKLAVSPEKSAVDADTAVLRLFGPAQQSDVQQGVAPRISRLLKHVARSVSEGKEGIEDYSDLLDFVSRSHPPAALELGRLYEEIGDLPNAERVVRLYLEQHADDAEAWSRLAELCRRAGDSVAEINALVQWSQLPGTPFVVVSNAANRLNSLLWGRTLILDSDEKAIIVRKLFRVMERRVDEANATDCSRLAWLAMHVRDFKAAEEYSDRGLELEPENEYCLKLRRQLSTGGTGTRVKTAGS